MKPSCRDVFKRNKRVNKYPLGRKYKPDKHPLVNALISIQSALFEADMGITALLHEREVKLQIVRMNADKNGRAFQKAQKAALECDSITARAKSLRAEKIALYGDLAKLYGEYSGDAVKGVVVAEWLCKNLKPKQIAFRLRKPLDYVESTLFGLRQLFSDITELREAPSPAYKEFIVEKWGKSWCEEE